jgi:hypothetical protein
MRASQGEVRASRREFAQANELFAKGEAWLEEIGMTTGSR